MNDKFILYDMLNTEKNMKYITYIMKYLKISHHLQKTYLQLALIIIGTP